MKRKVMAFYYMWFQTKKYSGAYQGWNYQGHNPDEGNTATTDNPEKIYDSNDPRIINKHLSTAKKAGIDVLIPSWWGFNSNFNKSYDKLLKMAVKHGIKIAPHIEVLKQYQETAIDELKVFIREYSKQKAIFKVNNKPVIFIYSRALNQFSKSEWQEILKELEGKAVFIADTRDKSMLELFDGAHNYCPLKAFVWRTTPGKYYKGIINECKKTRKISCFIVIPGYDDRVLKRKHTLKYWVWQWLHLKKGEYYVPRNNSRTYKGLWEQAIKADPDWVLITSFNEWHEGTEIEPSHEYGDEYIKLTREYSDKFKK